MTQTSNSTQEYLNQGASLLLENKYEEAEKVYRLAIELQPDHPWVNCNLGRSLLYQGKVEEAIPYLQKTIELDNNIAEAYYSLGNTFAQKNEFDRAVNAYYKAIELEPNKFIYYHQLADTLFLHKKYQESVSFYRKAIEFNFEYAWSYHNLGKALSELGRWEEAIAVYQKATELWPENADFHYGLGQAQVKLGHAEGGITEYRRAIELRPQSIVTAESQIKSQNPSGKLKQFSQLTQKRILVISRRADRIFSSQSNTEVQQYFKRKSYHIEFCGDITEIDAFSFDAILLLVHLYDEKLIIKSLRKQGYSGLIIGWFWDNHHDYYENLKIIDWVDVCIPGHGFAKDLLKSSRSILDEVSVPLCTTQWTVEQAQHWFSIYGEQERSNQLYGGFTRYDFSERRNRLIEQIQQEIPDHRILLFDQANQEVYFGLNLEDRFKQWCGYKVSLCLPLNRDLSQRFFDALLCGQVPIVPSNVMDLDRVFPSDLQTSLPVVRIDDDSVESIRDAYGKALKLFEIGGIEGARKRHQFAIERHMLVHRLQQIISNVEHLAVGADNISPTPQIEDQGITADEYIQKGLEAAQNGDFDQTIVSYIEAIDIKSAQKIEIYHFLTNKLKEIEDFERAIQFCQLGLNHYSEDVQLSRTLASCFAKVGEYEKAEKIFQSIVERHEEPWIIRELVEAQKNQEKLDEALSNIRYANNLLPDNCWLRWDLAQLLNLKGKKQEAVRELKQLIHAEDAPNWIRVQFLTMLGDLLQEEDRAQASWCYHRAFQLDRNNIKLKEKALQALHHLADDYAGFCFRYHLWEESEKIYQIVSLLDPNDAEARFRLGNVLEKLGKRTEAIKEYETCVELEPNNLTYLEKLGDIFSSQGGCPSFEELSFP